MPKSINDENTLFGIPIVKTDNDPISGEIIFIDIREIIKEMVKEESETREEE